MPPDTRGFRSVQTEKEKDRKMLLELARAGGFKAMETLYREHGQKVITTDDGKTYDLKEMFGEK